MRRGVIATVGLHASASTWLFNVAREVTITSLGEGDVLTCYADDLGAIPPFADRTLVFKSHHGTEALDRWLQDTNAAVLLTIRDPRDAAISMAQRFAERLSVTVEWLLADCRRMQRLMAAGHPVFRFEDRFFADQSSASQVAALLGLTLPPSCIARIASTYHIDAVRRFTRNLDECLAPADSPGFDEVTQLHRRHIGDATSGKWRRIPLKVQNKLTQTFQPFLAAFGYDALASNS